MSASRWRDIDVAKHRANLFMTAVCDQTEGKGFRLPAVTTVDRLDRRQQIIDRPL